MLQVLGELLMLASGKYSEKPEKVNKMEEPLYETFTEFFHRKWDIPGNSVLIISI